MNSSGSCVKTRYRQVGGNFSGHWMLDEGETPRGRRGGGANSCELGGEGKGVPPGREVDGHLTAEGGPFPDLFGRKERDWEWHWIGEWVGWAGGMNVIVMAWGGGG